MKKYIVPFLILLASACSDKKDTYLEDNKLPDVHLKQLDWLAGTWKSAEGNGFLYEIWKIENDSLFTGHGFFIEGTDTTFSEKLQLKENGNSILYIATVKGQNSEQPVPFKLMEFENGEYRFVNKEHDFPQRIVYKNPRTDFLCTRIEGTKNGKFRKSDSNFLRVKD